MISWAETLVYLNALSKKEGFEPCYDLSLCEGVVGGGCIGTDDVCSSDDFTCRGDVNRHANPYDCEGYRLPTNAEWQLAARAGTSTATYNGDLANNSSSIGDCVTDEVANEAAWDCSNASQVMPVGLKKRNDFGLYDMIGNVREWCADPWRNVRLGGGADDLVDPYGFVQDESAGSRVTSGGSWMDPSCLSRSASNGGWPSILRIANIGFRPVRTLVE
jgi:formylglycine-generating enzyme required for sulfatase activity